MEIACLGWGSLVWDPSGLSIRGRWLDDGPPLPIEFARKSNDGRVTLVLLQGVALVRSLWTLMSVESLDDARTQLADRERLTGQRRLDNIGFWTPASDSNVSGVEQIGAWACAEGLETVVWTALPPKGFAAHGAELGDEVVKYLRPLQGEARARAEQYVRCAPRQIDTLVRRCIERELGWEPEDYCAPST